MKESEKKTQLVSLFFSTIENLFNPDYFVYGCETMLFACKFMGDEISGDLYEFCLKWHRLFLIPHVLFNAIYPFTINVFSGSKRATNVSSNSKFSSFSHRIAMISMIHSALFPEMPFFALGILGVAAITPLFTSTFSLIQIIISALVGIGIYLASENFPVIFSFSYLPFLLIIIAIALYKSVFFPRTMQCQFLLTIFRNAGCIAFDALIRSKINSIYFSLFVSFVLHYIGQRIDTIGVNPFATLFGNRNQ